LKNAFKNNLQDIESDVNLKNKIKRFESILINELRIKANENQVDNFTQLLDALIAEINKKFNEAYANIESRPPKIFYDSLLEEFPNTKIPKKLEVTEFGSPIISNNLNTLGHPYIIQKVAYIDTPMSIGEEFSENKHWGDLNGKLQYPNDTNFKSKLSDIIGSDIIKGDISFEESGSPIEDEGYIYTREDGAIFNLIQCATGIKSFAIIQLLLKNGFLDEKTLLIIDEPEAHLHPQWIIEYARLLVLINKEIGVKFFIATHHPDMVSALKYISEKEETLSKINFYLSKKESNSFSYTFYHLGTDIEEIFSSFNIAIDRINLYGATS
jgi:hypothetical protein